MPFWIPVFFHRFFWLLVGHALADYPLQGDFLAAGKNHRSPLAGVSPGLCLTMHALIHGGAVAAVTGSVGLGVAETVVHAGIDYGKCAHWYGYTFDQWAHVACKVMWAALVCWLWA